MSFWNTKRGKILSHGIHEHNHGLANISHNIEFIKKLIENKSIEIKFKDGQYEKYFNQSLKMIINGKNKCKDSIDYIYTKIKEEEGF